MASNQVVYAHHKMAVSDSTIDKLFGEGKIGIDYGMGSVANPRKFKEEGKDTASINTMESLRKKGGIVVGQYHYDDLRILGYVAPGQNIEIVEADNGTQIKALQMKYYTQVHEREMPKLFNLSKGQQAVHNLGKDAGIVRGAFKEEFGEITV